MAKYALCLYNTSTPEKDATWEGSNDLQQLLAQLHGPIRHSRASADCYEAYNGTNGHILVGETERNFIDGKGR